MSKQTVPAATSIITAALPLPSGSAAGTSWAPARRAVNVTVLVWALATLPVASSPIAAITKNQPTRAFASWHLQSPARGSNDPISTVRPAAACGFGRGGPRRIAEARGLAHRGAPGVEELLEMVRRLCASRSGQPRSGVLAPPHLERVDRLGDPARPGVGPLRRLDPVDERLALEGRERLEEAPCRGFLIQRGPDVVRHRLDLRSLGLQHGRRIETPPRGRGSSAASKRCVVMAPL